MKKYFEIILFVVVLGFVGVAKTQQSEPVPYVIMVSFDGFRHDYVEKFDAPNLKAFINEGVAAEAMIPSYPSKTFPNHYTLVTGLYPDHHGLVDNTFYDKDLDLQYSIGNRERVENPAFYGGLPLWQLVQQNGMKSASYFWVGSEAPVAGEFPTYYHQYDGSVPNEDRVEAVINWLKLPETERPHFISLYFSLVDDAGHDNGPDHEETGKAVQEADRMLGLLKSGVDELDLPVDIILVSDHGMEPIYPKRENFIVLGDLMDKIGNPNARVINNGSHAHIYLNENDNAQEIINRLSKGAKKYQAYLKSDLPEHMHYGTHERIGDIVIVVEPGHSISTESRINYSMEKPTTRGAHGFDPYATENMGAIFYASGPSFKKGLKIEKFENVNVYPLVAEILRLKNIPKVDGDLKVLRKTLNP